MFTVIVNKHLLAGVTATVLTLTDSSDFVKPSTIQNTIIAHLCHRFQAMTCQTVHICIYTYVLVRSQRLKRICFAITFLVVNCTTRLKICKRIAPTDSYCNLEIKDTFRFVNVKS